MVFLAEGGIGALGLNIPSLIAQLINFTILFLVLGWAFKRFLFPLLDERRKRIQEGLGASEEVKRRVPIWKRERYADGTEQWVDPTREARSERVEGRGSLR